jgi:acetyltransferase
VGDSFQKRGIGSRVTERLLEFARDEKLSVVSASVLFENRPMQRLLEKHGFIFGDTIEDGVREGKLQL